MPNENNQGNQQNQQDQQDNTQNQQNNNQQEQNKNAEVDKKQPTVEELLKQLEEEKKSKDKIKKLLDDYTSQIAEKKKLEREKMTVDEKKEADYKEAISALTKIENEKIFAESGIKEETYSTILDTYINSGLTREEKSNLSKEICKIVKESNEKAIAEYKTNQIGNGSFNMKNKDNSGDTESYGEKLAKTYGKKQDTDRFYKAYHK